MKLKNFFKTNLTISLLILLSLVIILNNFFRFFQNNSAYQFDPWFSNYQGGFVRRGLPGEFFFQVYELLNIHPGWMVFVFVCFLYLFFYLIFFQLIKEIKLNKIIIFCLFSPLAFYFPIFNSKATGHKEIIFLFFLSLFCYLIPKIKKQHANYLMFIMAILAGLSYEVLIFYLAYLVIAFILIFNFKSLKDLLLNLLPIITISSILILINYYFKGTDKHVIEICNSFKSYVNPECQNVGKIADLKLSIKDHTIQKGYWLYGKSSLYKAYFKIYGIGFILGFLPLAILYVRSKIIKNNLSFLKVNPIIFLFFPIIITVPIYYMGADWGRYLYISYMSSLILIIFCFKNNIFYIDKDTTDKKSSKFFKFIFIMSIIIYGFGWTVPICCEEKFKPGISSIAHKAIFYYNRNN